MHFTGLSLMMFGA